MHQATPANRTANQQILVRPEGSRENDGLDPIQCGIALRSLSVRRFKVGLRLTGKDPLAIGSSSSTGISLSVALGGTIVAGGIITSSYPYRARSIWSIRECKRR